MNNLDLSLSTITIDLRKEQERIGLSIYFPGKQTRSKNLGLPLVGEQ